MQLTTNSKKIGAIALIALLLISGFVYYKHTTKKKDNVVIQIQANISPYDTTARQKMYRIDSATASKLNEWKSLPDDKLQSLFDSLYNK
jgi:hypothetical protein